MFIFKRTVYFTECDPAGILFFGNYFHLSHHAYESFMAQLAPNNYFNDTNIVLPILTTEAKYRKMIKAGDIVTIGITCLSLRENSFQLLFQWKDSSGVRLADITTTHVCVNKMENKKTALPEDLKLLLEGISTSS